MRTIAIDTEYDYCSPFLATTTDDELVSRVYRPKVLSQRNALKKICEDPNIQKVFHHASGDMFILRNVGIKVVKPYECTLIASNLVDENYSSRNLKKLAQHHLGIETKESNRLRSTIKKFKDRAKKEGRIFRWSEIPEEVMLPYAKKDPEYTIQLWYYWQTPIEETRKLYEFEKSIVDIIVDIEWKGMRIDRYLCARKSREYVRRMENLQEQMERYVRDNFDNLPDEFKPRSPKQISNLILALGLDNDVDKSLKTGMPKSDKKALQRLAIDNEFFGWLQQYRFFSKHESTYYKPLYEYYTSEESDVAHFMLYQTGAKTGRFSAELVQTFPKPEESKVAGQTHEVRKAVIPRRGKAFLCKDYEQQEMRLFVHYSNCERLADIINKKGGRGVDCYIETAEILFGKLFEIEEIRKPLRNIAKMGGLGGIYGIGQGKLISSITLMLMEKVPKKWIEKIGISEQWAYEALQAFYSLYPVRQFMNETTSELYKKGYIDLEFNSRLMNFSRRYHIPQDKAYKGPNAKIQGTAAYIIKHAMKRCKERIIREGWQNRVDMIMQVHDELIFEVDDDPAFIKEVDYVMGEEMEDHDTFIVPITCSGKWSNVSWGDVKEF